MKLLVKTFLGRFDIYDENHACVGKIKKKMRHAAILEVTDSKGHSLSTVRKCEDTMVINTEWNENEVAFLCYRTDAEGKRIQESLIRPPMAEKAELSTELGFFAILQKLDRSFEISLDGRNIARVTHMLSRTKEIRTCSSNIHVPIKWLEILFACCWHMLHDDDVYMV